MGQCEASTVWEKLVVGGRYNYNLSDLSQEFDKAKKPMVIVGSEMFEREDAAGIHAAVASIAQKARVRSQSETGEDWKVLNVLHKVGCNVRFIF